MKPQTFNRAQVLLQQVSEIDKQRQRLEKTNPRALRFYSGGDYVNIGELSPELAQTLIDIVKSDFDRQVKRLKDEFAALQDEPDRPVGPIPCV